MEAKELTDPNYILLGSNGNQRRNKEWFWYGDILLRAPRAVAQSAIVVVGSQDDLIQRGLDAAKGWVILLPEGYFGDDAIQGECSPSKVREFCALLRRLGIQESFIVLILLENSWISGISIVNEVPSVSTVYCRNTIWNAGDSRKSLDNESYRVFNNYKNNPNRWAREISLCSFSKDNSFSLEHISESLVYAPGLQADSLPGSEKFWEICSSLDSIVLSGGSIDRYIQHIVSGPEFLPYAGFLENISSNSDVVHISGNQVSVNANRLHIFGFNLIQSKPARGWGSYAHKLLIVNTATNDSVEYKLGSLRREILDKLQFPSNGSTNAYGAYALPKNQGIDLSELEKGIYRISVIDQTGYDTIPLGNNITYVNSDSSTAVKLYEKGDGIFLEIL